MKDYIITNVEEIENFKKVEDITTFKLQEIYKEFYTICKEILTRQMDTDEALTYPLPQIINSGDFVEQVNLVKLSTEINSSDIMIIDKLLKDYNTLSLTPKGKTSSALEYLSTLDSGMSHYFNVGIRSTYRILENSKGDKYYVLTFDWDLLDILSKQNMMDEYEEYVQFEPFYEELEKMFNILINDNLNIIKKQPISIKFSEIDDVSEFESSIQNDKFEQLEEIFDFAFTSYPAGSTSAILKDIEDEIDKVFDSIDYKTEYYDEPFMDFQAYHENGLMDYLVRSFKASSCHVSEYKYTVLNPADFPILSSINGYHGITDTELNDTYEYDCQYFPICYGLTEHYICSTNTGRLFVLNVNVPRIGDFAYDGDFGIYVRRCDVSVSELSNYYKVEVM